MRRIVLSPVVVATLAACLVACGSNGARRDAVPEALLVELPGAASRIDFDDIVYAPRSEQVLVPARDSGLYVVDVRTGKSRRYEGLGSVDSADEGAGLLFIVNRDASTVSAIDPGTARIVASADTLSRPDYVRYVTTTRELWLTEPQRAGIEVFSVRAPHGALLRRARFVELSAGAEGLTVAPGGADVYTHDGNELAVVDARTRTTRRLATGCNGTHGFPQVDEQRRLALASCSNDGTVNLLDLSTGRKLGSYSAGGGEALPAYSGFARHFYVRADPGTTLATLSATRRRLSRVRAVDVPEIGHCLTADEIGHVWTCDSENGRILRFDD